jgi:hypothetical protein
MLILLFNKQTSYPNDAAANSAARIVGGDPDDTNINTNTGPLLYKYIVTYNPCSPSLSVPTKLFSVNQLWKTCRPGMSAFYGPPSALTSGSYFSPPMTSSTPQASTAPVPVQETTSAVPGPSPSSITVSPTSTPSGTSATNVGGEPPASHSSTPTTPKGESAPTATWLSVGVVPSAPPVNKPSSTTPDLPVENPSSSTGTISNGGDSPARPSSTSTTPKGESAPTATWFSGGVEPQHTPSTVLVINSSTSPISTYQVGTQTLVAGAPGITVSGTTIGLQAGGSSVVIGTVTQPASILYNTPATVSGTVNSSGNSGSTVVNGQTVTASSSAQSTGIGGVIISLGGFATPSSSSAATTTLVVPAGASNQTVFTAAGSRTQTSAVFLGVLASFNFFFA